MYLHTGDEIIDLAFRTAIGDVLGNIAPLASGLLKQDRPVLMAGLDYDSPWTRDAAFNVWNGVALLIPEVARDTLLSVLDVTGDQVRIGGQYWDAVIWAAGAWSYHLHTADRSLLPIAVEAIGTTLEHRERTEQDAATGLFRGPACYGDGVSGYPDRYAAGTGSSEILAWPLTHPEAAAGAGYGLPMHALSTNCLYYHAYRVADQIAAALGRPSPGWGSSADRLRMAINQHFWNPDTGRYRYLLDAAGGCDRQEALGVSLAVLTGVAAPDRITELLARQHVTPAGVPCLWPPYERYRTGTDPANAETAVDHYGRHSGTVWPHIQALWAQACAEHGRTDLFNAELRTLAGHIRRDGQCAEIYHPVTGRPYGGLQETADQHSGSDARLVEWDSCRRQTWSATGYLRMILAGLLGFDFRPGGVAVRPRLLPGMTHLQLTGLRYCGARWDIEVTGTGTPVAVRIDGQPASAPYLPASATGQHRIGIDLA